MPIEYHLSPPNRGLRLYSRDFSRHELIEYHLSPPNRGLRLYSRDFSRRVLYSSFHNPL